MSEAELIPIAPRKLVNDDDSASSGAGATTGGPKVAAPAAARPAAAPKAKPADKPAAKTTPSSDTPTETAAETVTETAKAADRPTIAPPKKIRKNTQKPGAKIKKTAAGVPTPLGRKKRRLIEKAMQARRLTPEEILAAKKKKRALVFRAVAAGLLLTLFGSGGTWALTGPYADFFFPPHEIPPRDVKLNKSFELAGVQFGMTPAMVNAQHEILRRDRVSDRDTAMTFEDNGRSHTVWFRELGGLDEAWKLRYRQPAVAETMDTAIAPVLAKLGPLYQSSCEKSTVTTSTTCTFKWFGGDGVDVTVNARSTVSKQGHDQTALIVTAEDRGVLERQDKEERARMAREAWEQRQKNKVSAKAAEQAAREAAVAAAALKALEDSRGPKIEMTVFSAR